MENKDLEFTIRNILSLHLNNFYQENGLSVSCKTRTQAEDKIILEINEEMNSFINSHEGFKQMFIDELKRNNKLESDFQEAINLIESEFDEEDLNNPYTDLGKFYINYKKVGDEK